MDFQKNVIKKISISAIPFVFLLSIGLIAGDITLHQKVFKSFLIGIFDIALFLILMIQLVTNKDVYEKSRKYFIYFIAYFIFVLIQYIVTFFSKEISYDREYYLGNYILLLLISISFFLFLKNLEEVKIGLLFINIYIIIVLVWSIIDLIGVKFVLASFRPKLSFGNTNYFAGFHIGLLPLSLISAFVWYDRKKKTKDNMFSIILFVISVLGIIPLYFTQTRAALFGWYIGLFALFIPSLVIMAKRIPKYIKFPITLLLLIFFFVLPVLLLKFPPPIIKSSLGRLVSTMANPAFFINDRLNGWEGGLGLFREHPIFGAGLGTVYPASFKYMNNLFYMYSASNSFKHSHGEYVEVAGEAGIFGLIFFFSLFMFVIISLLSKAYSDKYKRNYRYISLAIAVGIVSMLFHQIFSLTMRMPVTMVAYFALLGLGIFMLSIKNSQLIDLSNIKESSLPSALNSGLNKKGKLVLIAAFGVFTIYGMVLISTVFRCEYNIRKALGSKYREQATYYFDRATKVMPGNPYAWTQKYTFDFNYYTNLIRNFQNNENYYRAVQQEFNSIISDLNNLNNIISGYQDVWGKYSQLYLSGYDFNLQKYSRTQNFSDFKTAFDYLQLASQNLSKSINMNFLNENNHLIRLVIQNILNVETQFAEYVKDYARAKVYLNFAKPKLIVKERIKINYSDIDKTEVVKDGRVFVFNISLKELSELSNKCIGIKNINELRNVLESGINEIFKFDEIEL